MATKGPETEGPAQHLARVEREREAVNRRVQQRRMAAAVLPPVAGTLFAGFLGPDHYRAAVNLILGSIAVAGAGYWIVDAYYLRDERRRLAAAHREAASALREPGGTEAGRDPDP